MKIFELTIDTKEITVNKDMKTKFNINDTFPKYHNIDSVDIIL